MVTPVRAYHSQKNVARQRGIPWELTYGTWIAWWEAQLGPNWFTMRGRKAGQYCMSRKGDIGAYNLENIRCILHVENSREAAPRMTKAFKQKRGPKVFYGSARPYKKGRPKLSKEQVIAIKTMNGSNAAIARQFGVSAALVKSARSNDLRVYAA